MNESIVESPESSPEPLESEVILALAKRAELAESRLAEVAGILKGVLVAENSVSYSDRSRTEKVNQIRARALNKLDCVVSYLND